MSPFYRCVGSRRESRTCNLASCITATTTRTTTTTTTTRPRLPPRPPRPRSDRVQCYVCGSLFSTDAPDCLAFNARDPKQQKTCEAGEACLWYSYQQSEAGGETAVVRECFSTSILLGSISDPIRPAAQVINYFCLLMTCYQ